MMSNNDAKSNPALGFLTVINDPQFGLFGGYLVLNLSGRPLEFHCSAPIKPNRAQEILYGPTLEPFLYGEQIGRTLINQASTPPLLICTDRDQAMAAPRARGYAAGFGASARCREPDRAGRRIGSDTAAGCCPPWMPAAGNFFGWDATAWPCRQRPTTIVD